MELVQRLLHAKLMQDKDVVTMDGAMKTFYNLVVLWEKESHWNMYAQNRYSGAYGIHHKHCQQVKWLAQEVII